MVISLLLLSDLLFHCFNDHPHSNQLGFKSLYLCDQLVLLFAKIDARPPTVRVKLCMIGLAVWEP
jgi:hypothetical protein